MTQDGAVTRLPSKAGRTSGSAFDLSASVAMESDPEVPMPVPRDLSPAAKAAIVVRLLLNEGADLPLEELPEEMQARLTQQMGALGLVDRVTLAAVALEFAEALDSIGLACPGGLAGALSALDGRISPRTVAKLRREAGFKQTGDPWQRLQALPVEDLAAIVAGESVEVAAVLLSKLEIDLAARLLGQLPGPTARQIAFAVSQTERVTPETVERIGRALVTQIDARQQPAFDTRPGERVGEILNRSPAATRDEVLSALDEADQDFAGAVRKAIFTFIHIPARLAPADVPKAVRGVEQADLVAALHTAMADGMPDEMKAAAQFILGNLPTRLADSIREEIEEATEIGPADGERAMTVVVSAIKALEAAGDIKLRAPATESEAAGQI